MPVNLSLSLPFCVLELRQNNVAIMYSKTCEQLSYAWLNADSYAVALKAYSSNAFEALFRHSVLSSCLTCPLSDKPWLTYALLTNQLIMFFHSGTFGALHAHVWSRPWEPGSDIRSWGSCSFSKVHRWEPCPSNVSPTGDSFSEMVCRVMSWGRATRASQEFCTAILGWWLLSNSGLQTECDLSECVQRKRS